MLFTVAFGRMDLATVLLVLMHPAPVSPCFVITRKVQNPQLATVCELADKGYQEQELNVCAGRMSMPRAKTVFICLQLVVCACRPRMPRIRTVRV